MTGFDEREKGFERKFEHDQELAFKVRSRRRKLLGLWAAEKLGLTGTAAEAYADELARLGLHRGGDQEEAEHIARDLAAKGVTIDVAHIMLEAERCEREAKKQLGGAS
ncbi:MAG TPA: DUF1476 domain-containing protein [Stellaceae bacterium]|nr:DUF1476 domain-containing protein [Stellaceae bacterium]